MNTDVVHAAAKVLTLAEVAEAAGISLSTLRREIARGTGPEVVSLSPRRKGVRSESYRRWLDGRTIAGR
jgi:predicted DNA-binding transcriptional regulator AlpA